MTQKLLITTALGLAAICYTFPADSTQTSQATAPNLSTHSEVVETEFHMLGDAKTRKVDALETYLLSDDVTKDIEEEFGEVGLRIVRRTYATQVFKPLWTEKGALDLQHSIYDVFEHGILAEDVFSDELDKIVEKRFDANSLDTLAQMDVELSLIWLRYAKAMSGSLSDEGEMVKRANSPVLRFSIPYSLALSAKGEAPDEILSMAPEAPQYARLKSALAKYRALSLNGGWLAIRDGDAVKTGESDPRIPALRTRLRAEGYDVKRVQPSDASDVYDPNVYDPSTELALKEFQRHHGLEDDGILGGNTLLALNESVESKISRIADSMYRWRVQGELGDRYIWANIPSYTAEGWSDGKVEIKQKTIVGKERFATPEFSDEVEFLVANPKWYLPISIVRRQKLPKLKKDPGYAAKYGYNIFDRTTGEPVSAYSVDWTEPGVARKYQFVQQAGDGNALGEMKIIFPNQYSVYLHGTPGEHLFEKAQRAFSSGCVRLEDPVAMGKWIARYDEEAEVSEINAAMAAERNQRLDLEEEVPVHITYFTVTVDETGQPYFWRDIYDRLDEGIEYVKRYEDNKKRRKLG